MQLQKYQEFCELLDPYLEGFVSPVMRLVRDRTVMYSPSHSSSPATAPAPAASHSVRVVHACFRIVYALAKIRGYKTVGM